MYLSLSTATMNNYIRKTGLGIALTSLLYAGCAGFVAPKQHYSEYHKKIGPFVVSASVYVPKEVKFGLKVPESADTNLDALVSGKELKRYIINKIK
jgi:hypothetical protein